MEIQVHGKKMQVSGTINEHVVQKLERAVRFWDGKVGITDVELSEEPNPRQSADRFRVEITAPVAGHTIRVHASSHDQHAAVDAAVDKFERQLRRLKERVIGRSRNNNKRLNQTPSEAEVSDELPPSASIVRSKQFTMKPMSPEEAALQMEMLGHSFFFFFNAETDGHAVLYRRRDGQLGLIESK
ncbi:MAG: ribosome-associated translation inhibitor RaiA [Acidimicrobiia bacterium]|nr:ribosome-associated translation inhibitor RaiA [Acidimicrobiia bacterium]